MPSLRLSRTSNSKGWHRVTALDTGDVLVRNPQLDCKLLLGELEGLPLGVDPAGDLDSRWLLHNRSLPTRSVDEQTRTFWLQRSGDLCLTIASC